MIRGATSASPHVSLALALGGLLCIASLSAGAVIWISTSQIDTTSQDPPVRFVLGDQATNERYLSEATLSPNATYATLTVTPVAGAITHVNDVLRLETSDETSRSITLSAPTVSNANVQGFEWRIRNETQQLATLDYTAGTPSTSITVPATGVLYLDLWIDLADGAGNHNAAVSFSLEVTL